jgi:hypothetical protein
MMNNTGNTGNPWIERNIGWLILGALIVLVWGCGGIRL